MVSRRQILATVPAVVGAASTLAACTPAALPEGYQIAAAKTWRTGPWRGVTGGALMRELVHCATLAPSSHNTQAWTFSVEERALTIRPDLSRRCPAVDPDDHHLFVSLGCATENLVQTAQAQGFEATPVVDATQDLVRVTLAPSGVRSAPLFEALALRQCTRGDYDGEALSREDLNLLARAAGSSSVRMLLLSDRPDMERVLELVLQGNTAQRSDPAFVRELKSWIRFSGTEAVRTRDGLFTACSGNPVLPSWLGGIAFDAFFTAQGENDKIARQVRNSAGLAVFFGDAADKAHWVEVGRAYERFALQATALGIRNAFLNQPVEVAALRAPLASTLGLSGQRPDLVVRFGRGPTLPRSLRRPVDAVLA